MSSTEEGGTEDLSGLPTQGQGVSGVSQEDYRALFDKLILAEKLFRERDITNHETISSLKISCEAIHGENVRIRRKNLELRRCFVAMRAERKALDEGVAELSHAANLLEMREQEMDAKLKACDREKENNRTAFEALQKRCEGMVPGEAYHRLQATLTVIIEDHKLAEESTLVFEEERQAAHLAAREAEKRCELFKNRVDALELELRSVLIREDASKTTVATLDQQVRDVDQELRDISRRLVQLEGEKSALLTQINFSRMARRVDQTAFEQQCAAVTAAASVRELALQEKNSRLAAELEAASVRELALQEKTSRLAAEL